MLYTVLLIAHIAVLGYWLGSELVINSTFRFVSWGRDMAFAERNRLMEHVMEVDQHVRYALVLQLGLGFALAALMGWIPGGTVAAWSAGVLATAWLVMVEVTHRLRHAQAGPRLAAIDRALRYLVMLALLLLAATAASGVLAMPAWLAWKLALFAGVMACGVGIRFALISYFEHWRVLATHGSSDAIEGEIRRGYTQATAILVCLWVFIAAIVVLSIMKPV
ncbi:MAG: hypothetical protein JJU27_18975 [Gammaproteobacteria bacterium]|nr:hypothetical protein [Gammaproteobacteria bacterium]